MNRFVTHKRVVHHHHRRGPFRRHVHHHHYGRGFRGFNKRVVIDRRIGGPGLGPAPRPHILGSPGLPPMGGGGFMGGCLPPSQHQDLCCYRSQSLALLAQFRGQM